MEQEQTRKYKRDYSAVIALFEGLPKEMRERILREMLQDVLCNGLRRNDDAPDEPLTDDTRPTLRVIRPRGGAKMGP